MHIFVNYYSYLIAPRPCPIVVLVWPYEVGCGCDKLVYKWSSLKHELLFRSCFMLEERCFSCFIYSMYYLGEIVYGRDIDWDIDRDILIQHGGRISTQQPITIQSSRQTFQCNWNKFWPEVNLSVWRRYRLLSIKLFLYLIAICFTHCSTSFLYQSTKINCFASNWKTSIVISRRK